MNGDHLGAQFMPEISEAQVAQQVQRTAAIERFRVACSNRVSSSK
jgi:hypothetical protein